jgi:hypothetical protein
VWAYGKREDSVDMWGFLSLLVLACVAAFAISETRREKR